MCIDLVGFNSGVFTQTIKQGIGQLGYARNCQIITTPAQETQLKYHQLKETFLAAWEQLEAADTIINLNSETSNELSGLYGMAINP